MKKPSFFLITLVISFLIHILVILSCFLYIDAKASPLIYSWFNIIDKRDLFFREKNVIFPIEVNFPLGNAIRTYSRDMTFLPASFLQNAYDKKPYFSAPIDKTENESSLLDRGKKYFYLWEKEYTFPADDIEAIPYKAYVSKYGKVLFLYPEKLPINSYGGIYLQKHIRQAGLFLNDKFFWTKLAEVVK